MNYIKNDFGVLVLSVGAPCSVERVKVEYPKLIYSINSLYWDAVCESLPGHSVDIAVRMIRDAGISSPLETRSILQASAYSQEGPDTVTALVLRV